MQRTIYARTTIRTFAHHNHPIRVFSVETTRVGCRDDIGPLTAVDVSLVGEDAWFLEKLLIYDLVDGDLYEVECDCWCDDGNESALGSRRMRHLSVVKL